MDEHTHIKTHRCTRAHRIINQCQPPSSPSPTVLIHLSLLSSVRYFHTQLFSLDTMAHLSNLHPSLIHLIPLSLHASSNYQSCTFTVKLMALSFLP